MMASIEISYVEMLALKKLALINGALAKSLSNPTAKSEQTALLQVLLEVASRADDAIQNAAEAAWERQQQSLMESVGPDDSSYRRDMQNAGRGHLLKG